MTSPYTSQPAEAYMAAQASVGIILAAMLWLRGLRSRMATCLLLAAIALAVIAPVEGEFLGGVGVTVEPLHLQRVLKWAAALATIAMLLGRRAVPAAVAALGEAALWPVTNYVRDSDLELAAAHVAFFGLLVGLHWRFTPSSDDKGPATQPGASDTIHREWVEDIATFVLGTACGAIVCRFLLHGWTNSGDEWANTFQAALFAKLHAFGTVPRCSEAFRSFWVFQYMGRSFSQYTPGWPLFMAVFAPVHLVWLAGPASLGILAAGVSRLGRRAADGFSRGSDPPHRAAVLAAGRFAAIVLLMSSTVLINGGSRYPHVFVAAMFAWSVEALLAICSPDLSMRQQWAWGTTLGGSAALLVAARPGDGCMLGIGLFLYFCYALARRRTQWRAIAGAAIAFGAIAGLTLVVLRLQLGRWFATGYSLTQIMYPWAKFEWSKPQPSDYRWGLPLATGAYCWWPCSPAVGLAGLAALKGPARRIGFIFFFAFIPFVTFYTLLSFGRGFDLGYGPRYLLPSVVPMSVGTGVVLARLWQIARVPSGVGSALHAGGPAAVALCAVILGVVRIAPLVYPPTYADVQNHNRLHEGLAPLKLKNAVVIAGSGLTNTDQADLPENLPLDLYPKQDVLIAVDRGADMLRCLRDVYSTRTFYRAMPGTVVQIVPLE